MNAVGKKKKHDPWLLFRRELMKIVKGAVKLPVNFGDRVRIETVSGEVITGQVIASSVVGIVLACPPNNVTAWIPMTAIDRMVYGSALFMSEAERPEKEDTPAGPSDVPDPPEPSEPDSDEEDDQPETAEVA